MSWRGHTQMGTGHSWLGQLISLPLRASSDAGMSRFLKNICLFGCIWGLSSLTRVWVCVPCIARWILNHCKSFSHSFQRETRNQNSGVAPLLTCNCW